MFVRRFAVKNFMIHRDTSVDLSPIAVFVGPNNGGKSALFDALLNFTMVSRGRLSQAFGPGPYSYRARKSRGAAAAARISFDVDLAASAAESEYLKYAVSYSQVAGSVDPPRYQIFDERLALEDGTTIFDRSDPDSSTLTSAIPHLADDQSIFTAIRRAQFEGTYAEVNPLVTHVAREISRIGKFRLNPQFMSQPSRLPDVPAAAPDETVPIEPLAIATHAPTLDYRGEGLATVLYFMAETASPALDRVTASLAKGVTGFEGFEFNTVGADRVGFSVRFADARGVVAAANLSDGTLALIGLTVLLAGPSRLPVICIEEPENGLTPSSIRSLYTSIRAVAFSEDEPPSQILLSSHSPHVICEAWNGLDREFIFQVKPTPAGRAEVRRFSEIIEDLGAHLETDSSGMRTRLNLNLADEVMDGYLS